MSTSRRGASALAAVAVSVVVAAVLAVMLIGEGDTVPSPDDTKAGPLGNFTDASSGLPTAGDYYYVALVDLDGDGRDDIVASAGQYGGTIDTHGVRAYLSRPDGTWADISQGLPTQGTYGGLGVGDLTGDGRPELVASTEGWSGDGNLGVSVWVAHIDGARTTWDRTGGPVDTGDYHQCVVADVDGDGQRDIVAAGKDDGVRVWLGERTGAALTWTEAGSGLPRWSSYTSVAVADLDGDGAPDIAATPYSGASPNVRIFLGDGRGGFTDASSAMPPTSRTPIMVEAGDIDADGDADLVVSLRDDGLQCFLGARGPSGLSFKAANTGLPRSGAYRQLALGDVDRDGDLDLLAACMDRGLELYLANASGGDGLEWVRVGLRLPEGEYSGASFGDIDGDHVLDVAGAMWGTSTRGGLRALLGTIERA